MPGALPSAVHLSRQFYYPDPQDSSAAALAHRDGHGALAAEAARYPTQIPTDTRRCSGRAMTCYDVLIGLPGVHTARTRHLHKSVGACAMTPRTRLLHAASRQRDLLNRPEALLHSATFIGVVEGRAMPTPELRALNTFLWLPVMRQPLRCMPESGTPSCGSASRRGLDPLDRLVPDCACAPGALQ